MDRRANVKWIYAIGVVLIITNAASGVSGIKPDNSTLRRLATDNTAFDNTKCCQTLKETCGCNMVKTRGSEYHLLPIRSIDDIHHEFKFKVKAESDAVLTFTFYRYPRYRDPVYEIILGAKANTLSSIRTLKGVSNNDTVEVLMENVVSPKEWREFWVQLKNYTVKVGRKDENAFMELKNAPGYRIVFYHVAGWGDNYVFWSLPCIKEKDF